MTAFAKKSHRQRSSIIDQLGLLHLKVVVRLPGLYVKETGLKVMTHQ